MTDLELIDKLVLDQINADLERADNIWIDIFTKSFEDEIDYLFRKGSTIKRMRYKIDYVPVLSDADLHFAFKGNKTLGDFFDDPVKSSLEIANTFNKQFVKEKYFHVPRMQILDTTKLKTLVDFVPTPRSDIKILLGDYNPSKTNTEPEKVRKIDANNLSKLKEEINNYPYSFIDRGGFDYWSALRKMSWKISPTPIRLLTQYHDNPIELWSMSRSKIYLELQLKGMDEVAKWFKQYYDLGWELFYDGFNDIDLYTKILYAGYKLLQTCFLEFQKLS